MEEFLYTHQAVREGSAIDDVADMAGRIGFASLKELPLLTNLPEAYWLHMIAVEPLSIRILYITDEALVYEDASALYRAKIFELQINRQSMDFPLEYIMSRFHFTEEDLIYGRYFHEQSSTFYWAHNHSLASLRIPRDSFADKSVYDLLQFTEIIIIDLADEAKVAEIIKDFAIIIEIGEH